jgi:succinate-semialdehyde dehydrogenase / glutarate-semialdehyde dehydrogenase
MGPSTAAADLGYPRLRLCIAGAWREKGAAGTLQVRDPATGGVIADLPAAGADEVAEAAEAARAAFKVWRRKPAIERAAVLMRAADSLRADQERIARVITLEAGKPLTESRGEVGIAADTLDWFAAEARRLNNTLLPSRATGQEFRVERVPVGPVAAFCAWNAPLANPIRKIAPALATGCTVVLKASEETPAGAIELALALEQAGLPKGALNLVFGDPAAISAQLIAHPAIRKITFTGSTTVGKQLAQQAASFMKPATMELGGHAPVFVFDDVDVDAVAGAAVKAKYRNAGQICFSPSRFWVHDKVFDAFVRRFCQLADALNVGPGLDAKVEMGPLAHDKRVTAMGKLCDDAGQRGSKPLIGGAAVDRPGYFWKPTAYADLPREAALLNVEPFGPIATFNRFTQLDEALQETNRLPYGLSAYAFTRSRAQARALVEATESGTLGINTFQIVLPEIPFGGVRDSGQGREGGAEGMQPYLLTRFTHWA